MTMTGSSRRWPGPGTLRGIGLVLLVASAIFARTAIAGEPPDAGARQHGRLTSLSLRIAQAEGNERKIRKYKCLARQQRGQRNPSAPFTPLGTRALRPDRRP